MSTKSLAPNRSMVPLVTASALLMAPIMATAAAPDAGDVAALEEVTVTSTRTGVTLAQDTPAAISALSSASLDNILYQNIRDLEGVVPSLSVSQSGESGRLYLRGVGTNLDFIGSDPSVAVYLDGVYLARPAIVFADFIDIDRIEVLRGPQGTLYGRNAAGGVISVISRQPGNQATGRFVAEVGSDGKWRASAGFGGPIVADTVAASVSVMHMERDGYSRNANPLGPDRLNGQDVDSARGMIRITPRDGLEISLAADYYKLDAPYAYRPLHVDVFGNPVPSGAQVFEDPYQVRISIADPRNTVEAYGFSGQVRWNLSDSLSLTSITAYRGIEQDLRADTDFTEIDIFVSNVADQQHQFSQEFQLQGRNDALSWVAGLYYFRESDAMDAYIELPGPGAAYGFGPTFANPLDVSGHTKAYAAFTQGTYAITDRLNATAGIRYSHESKDIDKFSRLEVGGVQLPFGDIVQVQSDSWEAWTPKFGLDYRISDEVLAYVNVTDGFKSGGFNFSAAQAPFEPESLWAFEAGLKSDWLDNRVRVNASAFYYDYKDLQIQGYVIPDDGTAAVVEISNAANAEIRGLELELSVQPVREFLLSAALTYLDAEYGDYVSARSTAPDVPVILTGNKLNNAPAWAYSLGAQYTVPLGRQGTVSARADYRWRDRVYYTVFNDAAVAQGAFGLLNSSVSWESADARWKITAYGRNLTDELYYPEKPDYSPAGVGGALPEPRTFGVTAGYSF